MFTPEMIGAFAATGFFAGMVGRVLAGAQHGGTVLACGLAAVVLAVAFIFPLISVGIEATTAGLSLLFGTAIGWFLTDVVSNSRLAARR